MLGFNFCGNNIITLRRNNIITLRWPWVLLATQCWFTTSQSAAAISAWLPASSSPLPSPWRDTRCKDVMYHVQGYQVPGARIPCTRYQKPSIRCWETNLKCYSPSWSFLQGNPKKTCSCIFDTKNLIFEFE